jgi:two-component system sensor histidine kinase UhpB
MAWSVGVDGGPRRPVRPRPRYLPVLWRVVVINAAVLVIACVVTMAVFSPRHLSMVAPEEAGVLVASLGVLAIGNLLLLRRALLPLQRLAGLARGVDPTRPGQRVAIEGPDSEAGELAAAFNEMLARLEAERRESTRRALAAQESERLRVAQELHDEVGQTLTAVLLQLGAVLKDIEAPARARLGEAQETVRASLEDVRRIALELRPEALEDLGLASALDALCGRLRQRTGLRVDQHIATDLPPLGRDEELVIYRVAQEALTNIVRHAPTPTAELRLERSPDRVRLSVVDGGRGLDPGARGDGVGLRGMRERALLIGADLSVRARPRGGVCVQLDVPLSEEGLWYR